jgi:hypothetical protein
MRANTSPSSAVTRIDEQVDLAETRLGGVGLFHYNVIGLGTQLASACPDLGPTPEPEILQFFIHLLEPLESGSLRAPIPRACQQLTPLLSKHIDAIHHITLGPLRPHFEHRIS